MSSVHAELIIYLELEGLDCREMEMGKNGSFLLWLPTTPYFLSAPKDDEPRSCITRDDFQVSDMQLGPTCLVLTDKVQAKTSEFEYEWTRGSGITDFP